jgi:hypothetical protein
VICRDLDNGEKVIGDHVTSWDIRIAQGEPSGLGYENGVADAMVDRKSNWAAINQAGSIEGVSADELIALSLLEILTSVFFRFRRSQNQTDGGVKKKPFESRALA